jgi:hypothetical protein
MKFTVVGYKMVLGLGSGAVAQVQKKFYNLNIVACLSVRYMLGRDNAASHGWSSGKFSDLSDKI